VRKLWLSVALVAFGGLAINTFADVQNIRLSGDIRIRGYYLYHAASPASDTTFISQRTRVSVEADLEDHVLVVVTLKAEGLWGQDNQTDDVTGGSGAGTPNGGDASAINRRWDAGITEAYVQFNELFYTPATLKLGRQYLHYGHGMIISSVEQEYNYDAARLVLDYYPLTIDLVAAKLIEGSSFSPSGGHGGADLFFVNGRYEMTDSIIKNVEGYFGWVSQGEISATATRVPPSRGGASPWIIGLRSDMEPIANLKTWVEGAYEGGTDGAGGDGIEAYLFNVGGNYTFKDTQWSPVVNGNFIWASGGGANGKNQFVPWFDYADGYNGYVFAPGLSNILILNLGLSVKPSENTTLALQGYYYRKVDDDSPAGSNSNVDFGGFGAGTSTTSKDLGYEGDLILGYDYSKDVRCQLVSAAFVPKGAYGAGIKNHVAWELRGEVNVKF
jgi:hypothetical protein